MTPGSLISEDHKAAVEGIEGHEQDPASREWRLVTRRGIRGRHFRQCSLDTIARQHYDVFFQDQNNKLIYLQEDDEKITSPFYRRSLDRERENLEEKKLKKIFQSNEYRRQG